MRIKGRIILGISLLTVFVLVIAGMSIISTIQVRSWENDIYEIRLISIDKLIEADRDAYQSHLSLVYLLWETSAGVLDSSAKESYIDGVKSNVLQVEERFNTFKALMTDVPGEVQEAIDNFTPQYSDWKRFTDQLITQYSSGNYEQSLASFYEAYGQKFDLVRNNLDILTEFSLEEAQLNHDRVQMISGIVLAINIGFAIVGFITSIVIIIMIFVKVLKPISQINSSVLQLSSGTGDLTQRLPVVSKDEMSELASNTNKFLTKTEDILIGLSGATQKAKEVEEGLVTSIEQNTAGATEITANVESITNQIENQNQNIQQIKENLKSMTGSIDVFDKQVADQAAMVEESTASVTEMIASIKNLAQIAQNRQDATGILRKTVNEGNHKVTESNDAVQTIHSDVDSILEMTQIISGIASQTNLLSMNAAIEAAHAGDAGKGFSVVAEEIRKLAETSSAQSTSINEVLARVVDNIQRASEASGHTSNTYGEILKEIAVLTDAFDEIAQNSMELETGGRQILDAMNHLSDHSQSVKTEATTIRETNIHIDEEMEDIANGSISISSAASEITIGMREVSESLVQMRELSQELSESMNQAGIQLNLFILSENQNLDDQNDEVVAERLSKEI